MRTQTPASATVPEYENRCGNPDCRGAEDHAPKQVREFPPSDPLWVAEALARTYGRH